MPRAKPITVAQLPDAITLKKFTEEYGYTRDAVNGKIRKGTWMEGREFMYSPDGKIQIIIDGYKKWLYSQSRPAQRNIAEGYFEHA